MLGERVVKQLVIKPYGVRNDTLNGLVDNGIDDLAKYRIVQYLRECAGPVDACGVSVSLGLHPEELVAEALESLASSGILTRRDEDPPLYALSCHPSLQNALHRLLCSATGEDRERILRALAASSLAKARERARSHATAGRG